MVRPYTDIIFAKIDQKEEHSIKNSSKFIILILFDSKGLDFINLNSIIYDKQTRNFLPDPLKDDEAPSMVYRFANTIQNKIFN